MVYQPLPRHVLIVDDDPAICAMLAEVLGEEGYAVATAHDGDAALDALQAGPHGQIVLLDLLMPKVDGRAVYRALVDDPALLDSHRLVIMSASANFRDGEFPRADAVLPKPFEIEPLLTLVGRLAA